MFFRNMLKVLVGKIAIVGYELSQSSSTQGLPKLKPGILHPMERIMLTEPKLTDKINLIYARDYAVSKDLSILYKSWRKLDRHTN